MGLLEIAYLTTQDQKTAQSLVRLMQILGRETLTFDQLLDEMRTSPRYLRFLIGKLRSIVSQGQPRIRWILSLLFES